MSETANEIRCMLIPLHGDRLLLPNAAVAEIIGYRDPDRIGIDESWLKGKVNWHQRELPVIDFERMIGRPDVAPGIRQRIAVCYAPDPQAKWPLYGIVAQGIPRLLRVSEDVIESATEGPHGESAIEMRLWIGGEALMVPDFTFIQERLAVV